MALLWLLALMVLSSHTEVGCELSRAHRKGGAHPNSVYPPETFQDEHDFKLTATQQAQTHMRKAASDSTLYWPDEDGFPNIPFAFTDVYVDRVKIWNAILEWESSTCITFTEVATNYSGAHLRISRHSTECSSYVGMTSASGQDVYITETCEDQHGELLHLIGYAIGFWPEETRSDRNSSVLINSGNVLSPVEENFPINDDNADGVPYDYCSIMHHHGQAFTSNGKTTISTLDPLYQGVIGQRKQISHMDKLLANTMYQCTSKLLSECSLGSDPCLNYGYLDSSCSCVCPDGTNGTFCDQVSPYEPDYCLSPYSEVITTETTITSPSSEDSPDEVKFTKVIMAPECFLVSATFTKFELYPRTDHYVDDSTLANICWYDGLEVRTDDMYDGDWYCGTDLQSSTVVSTGNRMILYFKTHLNFMPGWSADVTFVEDPECSSLPSVNICNITTSDDITYVESIDYQSYFPSKFTCMFGPLSSASLARVELTVNEFDLDDGESFMIENPYTSALDLSGAISAGSTYEIPSQYFMASFVTYASVKNFRFSFAFKRFPKNCDRELIALDDRQALRSPGYPRKKVDPGRLCEYRITTSDPSKRVRIFFRVFQVRSPSYLALNPYGDSVNSSAAIILQYPLESKRYTSTGNVLRFYFHNEAKSVGFKIRYRQID